MKINDEALQLLIENRDCRNEIAFVTKKHSGSVDRWIRDNEENGPLTTAVCLAIMEKHLKLKQKQILTKVTIA